MIRKCQSLQDIFDYIAYWDVERKNLPVATDGIVLKVNSFVSKELRFYVEKPTLGDCLQVPGRACRDSLELGLFPSGTDGDGHSGGEPRARIVGGDGGEAGFLHNADIIEGLDLHIGDQVYVEKGGEIIPKIVGVMWRLAMLVGDKVRFIRVCPECGTPDAS